MISELSSPDALQSRAQALVNAGAAVNVEGAKAILNATISLITEYECELVRFRQT